MGPTRRYWPPFGLAPREISLPVCSGLVGKGAGCLCRSMTEKDSRAGIPELLEVMARLRDPKSGCPWDIEQSFETIAPYTIEEAYEVAGAIEDRNWNALKEELGDLLSGSAKILKTVF